MSTLSIRDAVRMSVQVGESTGRPMDSAWVVALPVRVACAHLTAADADAYAMRARSRRLERIALPVIEVDIDAIHRKVPA